MCIDARLEDAHLTYGEFLLEGDEPGEVVIPCHTCHRSLYNDNLSGISLAVQLATHLESRSRRYSYRFVFAPATIGAIT